MAAPQGSETLTRRPAPATARSRGDRTPTQKRRLLGSCLISATYSTNRLPNEHATWQQPPPSAATANRVPRIAAPTSPRILCRHASIDGGRSARWPGVPNRRTSTQSRVWRAAKTVRNAQKRCPGRGKARSRRAAHRALGHPTPRSEHQHPVTVAPAFNPFLVTSPSPTSCPLRFSFPFFIFQISVFRNGLRHLCAAKPEKSGNTLVRKRAQSRSTIPVDCWTAAGCPSPGFLNSVGFRSCRCGA